MTLKIEKMKRVLILIASIVLMGCTKKECPVGYSGKDCSIQETPSSIRVMNINVENFPETNNGAGWDFTNGPDIYIVIEYNNEVIFKSDVYNNAIPSAGPYSFNPGQNLYLKPFELYKLKILDLDDFDEDDLMIAVQFRPYNNQNGFPSMLTISPGINLNLFYTW